MRDTLPTDLIQLPWCPVNRNSVIWHISCMLAWHVFCTSCCHECVHSVACFVYGIYRKMIVEFSIGRSDENSAMFQRSAAAQKLYCILQQRQVICAGGCLSAQLCIPRPWVRTHLSPTHITWYLWCIIEFLFLKRVTLKVS